MEVKGRGRKRYIFDAGTGIRALGESLAVENEPLEAEIFLTHFHWDHIQGFPFFGPLQDPNARLRIHAPAQEGRTPAELLAAQMMEPFFPVSFDDFPSRPAVIEAGLSPWSDGTITVDAFRACHPSITFGFRIRSGGAVLVYFPDNEALPMLHEDQGRRYQQLVQFCAGADLLVHDAMYTNEEYPSRVGWGHSTYEQALALAADAGVKRLRLFHHAPERDDAALAAIEQNMRDDLAGSGSHLDVAAAFEGEALDLDSTVQT
jgi:phosphoribosyl 1,2-cyclic phosphodiesterase